MARIQVQAAWGTCGKALCKQMTRFKKSRIKKSSI